MPSVACLSACPTAVASLSAARHLGPRRFGLSRRAPPRPITRGATGGIVLASFAVEPVSGTSRGAEVEAAIEALRENRPIAILDAADREGETDIFVPAIGIGPEHLRFLRRQAGGEMYVAISNRIASHFGLPYAGEALKHLEDANPLFGLMQKDAGGMCQGTCSVGLSFDHRSTHTGAPDDERSFTCRRFAELVLETQDFPRAKCTEALGREFHIPGHIFFCLENEGGIARRQGHSDLSVALARKAGVLPVMVGCVMLHSEGDDYGAVGPVEAEAWAASAGVPFVDGNDIIEALNSSSFDGLDEQW